MTGNVGFKLFLALWNHMQNQVTPVLHFRMADWLEKAWEGKKTRLLLQAFRSSGKSSIAGLFCAWLLYRQPDLRILVLAADLNLARKMVRQVRRIIERHPLAAHLLPGRLDQWGADRFTVSRRLELRDPSMLAKGISANVTGSRADIIICDDVEVPNTCDTAEKRRDLRERLGENDFVLTPGGTLLYIGTPHSWYTIYADAPRREIGEDRALLDDFRRLEIPVQDNTGLSAWPERFSSDDIARMQRTAGPHKFASQMMLQPVNSAEGRLDPAHLVFYDGELHKSIELGGLFLLGHRLLSASAWWDPAFGGQNGDASVLAIVFTDEDGGSWLHHIAYIRNRVTADEIDEATDQCQQIAILAQRFYLPYVAVETNGLGNFLPKILERELARLRVPCVVRKIVSTRPKDIRILEAFDALLAARALQAHDSVRHTPFVTEMQEWKPNQGKHGGRDDGLDAVAGALSLEPVRLHFERFGGRQDWRGTGKAGMANTNFEV